jgi:hypothetical protein
MMALSLGIGRVHARRTWCLALILGSVGVCDGPTYARNVRRQFSSSTELIRISTTVRDRTGSLRTDLAASDFLVRLGGREVPITTFAADNRSLALVVMVDMTGRFFHKQALDVVTRSVEAIAGQLTPADQLSVGFFSGERIVLTPAMTPDAALPSVVRDTLAIRNVYPNNGVIDAWLTSARPWLAGNIASAWSRPLWNAVAVGMNSLRDPTRKRAIVVLSNGPNTSVMEQSRVPGLDAIRQEILNAGVLLYSVSDVQPTVGCCAGRDETLESLAEMSGGGHITAAPFQKEKGGSTPVDPTLVSRLAGIVKEIRHEYVLGFSSTENSDRQQRLEIAVNVPKAAVTVRRTSSANTE